MQSLCYCGKQLSLSLLSRDVFPNETCVNRILTSRWSSRINIAVVWWPALLPHIREFLGSDYGLDDSTIRFLILISHSR
jgi:hypothetical protein